MKKGAGGCTAEGGAKRKGKTQPTKAALPLPIDTAVTGLALAPAWSAA